METRPGLLLVIRNGSGELVGKAETEEDLQRWMDAVSAATAENGRRRAKIMEERTARGEVRKVVLCHAPCVCHSTVC